MLSATTEMVCRLGMAHCLVGRSHGCDDPALATTLPVATAPKVDPNAPSAELDAAVRAQAAAGGPVYHIFNASVKALKPDVIITQDQCRICAVTSEDVQAACAMLGDGAARIVTIEPNTLSDVLGDVQTIAEACGVPERGARLVRHMKARMDVVRTAVAEVASTSTPRPKVAHLEWVAPLMGSGYWIAECIEAGGGDMICGRVGGNSAVLDGPERLQDADVIILAPCGFSVERSKVELDATGLLADAVFVALPAVRAGRCFVADGNKYFNRSSCGVVETAEMVAEMCYPELLGLWGHHGQWLVSLAELEAFCARPDAPSPSKPVPGPDPAHGSQEAAELFGGAAGPPQIPAPTGAERAAMSPEDVVKAQLAALKAADFGTAFELNSEQNKARLSSAEKFGSIVRGSSFNILLDAVAAVTTTVMDDQLGSKGTSACIRVDAAAPGVQPGRFYFDLGKASPEAPWATEGVRIEC